MGRAIRIRQTGGPEVLEVVKFEPLRQPMAGEVLVDMRAVGVNRSDVAFRAGNYLVQPNPPCGLGIEGSAIVRAVGEGVDRFSVGQRVCILPGFPQGGAYATYASEGLFPATSLIEAPDVLDDIDAAALWVSTLTAWGALVELGHLKKGDYVLISAAASSVGLAAIQIANIVGAKPIATTRSAAKAEVLKFAGASHVLVGENQAIAAMVRDVVGAVGLRLAFDPIAGQFAEALVPCMAEEGRIIIYGGLSDEPTVFDRRAMIAKGIGMAGYMLRQILARSDRLERAQAFVLDHLQDNTVFPTIDRIFALDAAVQAHRHMESNEHIGKIVLLI